jgi:O-antigen/teichoic acid export membrane protein
VGSQHVGRAGEALKVTPVSSSLTRRVVSGSAQISLASGVARGFSLLTIPLLTRWLGPTAYGVLSLAATIVGLTATLGLLGLDLAYARYFLEAEPQEQKQVEAFCWGTALLSSVVMTLVVSLVWSVLSQQWGFASRQSITLFLIPAIVLTNLATLATTRARLAGAYRKLAVAILLSAAVAALFSVGLAAAGVRGATPLLASALIGLLATLVLLGVPAVPMFRICVSSLSWPKRWQLLRLGVSSAITAPLYWLMTSSDRWFLAAYSSEAQLGIYSVSATLASSGLILNTAVTLTLFPEASRLYVQQSPEERAQLASLFERLALALALVWAGMATLGPPVLRLLTAPSFHGGTANIPSLAAGLFFYGLAGLGNLPYFLMGKMESVPFFWLMAAVLTLVGNWLLVPYLGGLGAAVVQTFAFAVLALLTLNLGRHILVMPIRWPWLVRAAFAALTWIVFCNWLPFPNAFWDLILKTLGMMVFSWCFVVVFLPGSSGLFRIKVNTWVESARRQSGRSS